MDLADLHADPPFGARHPTDGLLHQRAAEIVRPALEDRLARSHAHLDPGHLDVVDNLVEEDARDRVHPAVVLERRPGSRLPREVDRRVLVHERERHELREPTGALLDTSEPPDVRHPMRRSVDVPVHDRGRGPQADLVRGGHDLLPGVSGQLPFRQHPADVVVEDLRRGAGDRPEAAVLGLGEPLGDPDPEAGGAVGDLHGRERMDVDVRHPRLDRVEDAEVVVAAEVGVDAALHAHLGGAGLPCFLGAVGHLLDGEPVRVGVAFAYPMALLVAWGLLAIRTVLATAVDDQLQMPAAGGAPFGSKLNGRRPTSLLCK